MKKILFLISLISNFVYGQDTTTITYSSNSFTIANASYYQKNPITFPLGACSFTLSTDTNSFQINNVTTGESITFNKKYYFYKNGNANTIFSSSSSFISFYNAHLVASSGGGGTVTSVTAGTGLSGGTITSSGTISMPNKGTAGTYGSSIQVPVITTDAQGRITNVVNTSIPHDTTIVFSGIIFTVQDLSTGMRTLTVPSGYTKVKSVTLHDAGTPGVNEYPWVYDASVSGTTFTVYAWSMTSGGTPSVPLDAYNVTATFQ